MTASLGDQADGHSRRAAGPTPAAVSKNQKIERKIKMEREEIDRQRTKGLLDLLRRYAGKQGKSLPEMRQALGLSRNTMYKRLRDPDSFSRGELKRLGAALEIPDEELQGVAV